MIAHRDIFGLYYYPRIKWHRRQATSFFGYDKHAKKCGVVKNTLFFMYCFVLGGISYEYLRVQTYIKNIHAKWIWHTVLQG